MKILILGAAGFIGSQISHKVCNDTDNDVYLVDNYFRGSNDDLFQELISRQNCTFLNLDLSMSESFSKLDTDFDQIYFLASVVGVGFTSTNPKKVIEINTSIIFNVLTWLENLKSDCKILFSSTSECYASTVDFYNGSVPTPEDIGLSIKDISNPRYTYALTKMLGEAGIIHYCNDLNKDYVIVRFHNVYGPRMGFSHVIPQVVKRFLDREVPFKIYGYDQTRSFNFIDDAVQGTMLAMNKKTDSHIFHLGCSNSEITIEKLVKFIGNLLDFEGDYEYENAPSGSVKRRCPDISLAKNELGYEPKIRWEDGVKKTVLWYKNFYLNDSQ